MSDNYKNPAMPFVKAFSEAFGSGETIDEFCDRIFGREGMSDHGMPADEAMPLNRLTLPSPRTRSKKGE